MNSILEKILSVRSCRNAASNGSPVIGNLKLLMLVLCAFAGLTGCASKGGIMGVDCCSDIPAGAVPEPPGTKVCNIQQSQISAANLDQNVLYRADFVGMTTELAPIAIDRLARRNATGSQGPPTAYHRTVW